MLIYAIAFKTQFSSLLQLYDNYATEYDYSGLKYINQIFMVLHNPSQLSQCQLISCPGRKKHKKKLKLILIEENEGKLAISKQWNSHSIPGSPWLIFRDYFWYENRPLIVSL